MQIVELVLSHYNFYCPVKGESILKGEEPCNVAALSLQDYWLDVYLNKPFIKNKQISSSF